MVLQTIYIARHGYRSNWLPGPVPDPPTGIDSDFALAPHGEDQAKELAQHLANLEEDKPQLIFSSPFYRCLQTSTPISQALDLDILVENGIGEWYKPTRPVIPKPANLTLLQKFFNNLNEEWQSVLTPSSKGETEADIFNRCKQFWSVFVPLINEKFPNVKSIILVCHAASKIALGMSLLGFSNVREEINIDGEPYIRAGACSLDKYTFNNGKKAWELKINGRTDFLTKGEEMSWNFTNGFEAGSDEDIKRRRELAAAAAAAVEAPAAEVPKEEIEEIYVTLDFSSADLQAALSNNSQTRNNNATTNNGQTSVTRIHEPYPLHHFPSTRDSYYKNVYKNGNNGHNASLVAATSTMQTAFAPTATMQIAGLETREPFVKINDVFLKGDWRPLVGTEVFLDEKGNVVGTSKDQISLLSGKIVNKEQRKKEQLGKVSHSENTFEMALKLAIEREEKEKEQQEQNGEGNINNDAEMKDA